MWWMQLQNTIVTKTKSKKQRHYTISKVIRKTAINILYLTLNLIKKVKKVPMSCTRLIYYNFSTRYKLSQRAYA